MSNPGRLNRRIEIWELSPTEDDELHAQTVEPVLLKKVWAQISPKTGSMLTGRAADTILTKTTHEVRMRQISAAQMTKGCYLIYRERMGGIVKEHRFDIDYMLPPTYGDDLIQVFVQEVLD